MNSKRIKSVYIFGFILCTVTVFSAGQTRDVRVVNVRDQRRIPGTQPGFRPTTGRTPLFQAQQQMMAVPGRQLPRQLLPSNRRRPLINFASSSNPTLISSRSVLRVSAQPQDRLGMRRQPFQQRNSPVVTPRIPITTGGLSPCTAGEVLRCRQLPPNVSQRNVQRCNGNCPGRTCIVNCVCQCMLTTTGGDFRGNPNVGVFQGQRDGQRFSQDSRPRMGPGFNQRRGTGVGSSGDVGIRGMNLPHARRSGLNFSISDSVLASLLAQPELTDLIGPQGINDILAGVPPSLLPTVVNEPSGARFGSTSGNSLQRDMRTITAMDAARQREAARSGLRGEAGDSGMVDLTRNMGIPIPLSLQSMEPPPLTDAEVMTSMIALSDSGPFESLRDLIMPSATIDNRVRVTPNSAADSGPTSRSITTSEEASRINQDRRVALRPTSFDLGIVSPQQTDNNRENRILPSTNEHSRIAGSHSHAHDHNTRPDVNGGNGASPGQNFISGANPSSDRQGNSPAPTSDDCLSTRRELWCNSIGIWDGTPGLDRWCLLNCRSNNCDTTRCSCSCVEEDVFRMRNARMSRGTDLI